MAEESVASVTTAGPYLDNAGATRVGVVYGVVEEFTYEDGSKACWLALQPAEGGQVQRVQAFAEQGAADAVKGSGPSPEAQRLLVVFPALQELFGGQPQDASGAPPPGAAEPPSPQPAPAPPQSPEAQQGA